MMTTTLAKDLIKEEINNRKLDTAWVDINRDKAFFGRVREIGLLPRSIGSHSETVYDALTGYIPVNSVSFAHFKKDDCLFLNEKFVAKKISLGCGPCSINAGDPDAMSHEGEIRVSFEKWYNRAPGIVLDDQNGFSLTLDELEQQYPDFLKSLIFYLR